MSLHNGSHQRFLNEKRKTSENYIALSSRANRQYIFVGLCTIVFSSLFPVAAAIRIPNWIPAVLGAVVIIGHGFLALTRPHERAIIFERTGKMLSLEIQRYESCPGSKCKDSDTAWHHFVTRVIELESGLVQQETEINGLEELLTSRQSE
jgi:hypothetical protein